MDEGSGPLEVATKEKAMGADEVEKYLGRWWSFVAKLGEEGCVVRGRK